MGNGNGAKTKRRLVKDIDTLPLRKGGPAVLEAERERVEQVWAETEQGENAILNSLSEHVVFQDLEHRVLWTNKIAGESVGLPPEKLAGRFCYDVWGVGGKPCPGCPVERARKTGKPQAGEMTTPDGRVWLVKGYPILNASGDVTGLVEMTLEITERKQAEDELQEEKNKLQSVVSAMGDGLTIQDKDFNIIYLNEQLRENYGDRVGEKCYRVYENRDTVCDGCQVKKAFKDGRSHTAERQVVLPSGEVAFGEVNASPIRDAGGRIVSCLEIIRNITERKQAEEKLRESETFQSGLLANSPIPINVINPDSSIRYVSPALEKMTGFSAAELIGHKAPYPYWVEELLPENTKTLKKAMRQGGERVVQLFKKKNGERFWVEITSVPVKKDGKLLFFLASWVDITERKKAEEALADETTRRRILIEQSLDGIVVLDEDAKVYEANQRFAEMLGYTPEEVRELHTWDWDKNFPPEQLLEMGRNVDETGLHLETKHHRKDGTTIDVEISINGAICSGQKFIFCVCRDITERKKAEEELQAEKNKMQSVIGAMEDGLNIMDKDYKIIYQNELARRLYGDRVGEKCYRVYGGNKEVCDGCPVAKAFKDGESHTSERKLLAPWGKVTFWESTASPIRDAGGDIASCLTISRDITERKQADDALQAEKNKLQSVISAMDDGLTIQDKDFNIIYQNEPLVKIFGERLGEKCYRVYEGKNKLCDGCPVAKAFKDGKSHITERRVVMPSGEVAFWENTANPIRDANGKIVSCLEVTRNITERKQAEEALADEATRHRILIDESSDGIVILDEKGKVYEANRRFAEMLGYTPEEVRKLSVWDWEFLYEPEKVAEMIASIGPEGDHFETQHRRKDGTVFDVGISTNGAFYAGQKLIFCVCRDITERKQADRALLEAEKKYKNLVEVASDLIWEVDTQGKYTFVSPNIKDLLGYEVDEVVGKKRTLDFTPKKEVRKWLKRFKQVNAKREGFSGFEVLHLHKDGSPLIFEVSGIPFFDSAGNFQGYVGTNKDVTERKQMTEALRESQEFSTGLLENSPNPIFVLNPDTSVRYVNPAFEKLTGYKLAEIAGKKAPYPWWSKEESKAMTISLKKTMLSGGKRSEKVFRKKNGEPFSVALNSAPVIHRKKVLYFLISWLDITDRKRAEEEKVELERKAHLASRLASVGEMASGIAHEINNPLTAVIGFAQLLMDTDLPEEIKEDLVIIHKEAQRAAGVARNLLTFARKHAPSKQPTNVNSIIEGVLALRAYEQNVSNIQINANLTPDLPEVMADYSQLQQVFINIILNAEAAMLDASNGGTLTITTEKYNHSVRASFTDDGPGIDKEVLNRIFDPFFTTKEVGKGTGLGLSVCHGIIAEHGGKIYARSKLGSGATFIVELPINNHEQVEEPNGPAKEPGQKDPGS